MGFDTTLDGAFGFPEDDDRPGRTLPAAPPRAQGERLDAATRDRNRAVELQQRLAPLVARMAGGDEAALATLYDETVGRVYGFALRIVGRPAAAEEIAADVFHQAWRDAKRYDASRAKVSTWLLMMCRSRALDWLRAADAAITHEDPASLVEDPPVARSPADLLESTETSSAVHRALASLNPIQRQLVGLAFFRGLSHHEISEHSGLPLGTVKSHLRRALEALRTALRPD